MSKTRRILAALGVAAVIAVSVAGASNATGVQAAATLPHPISVGKNANNNINACVDQTGTKNYALMRGNATGKCNGTDQPVELLTPQSKNIPAGAPGKDGTNGTNGAPGAKGDTGPSGVTAVKTTKFDANASVAAGGKFVDLATEVGKVDLKAGTYMLSFNAKVKPNGVAAADIFPQFFVYDQAKNASFDGDLFNIGAGALEPGTTTHDSYFTGSSLVTLATDKTIHVYAFGYLANNGADTYNLETAQLDVVSITPAS